MACYTQGTKNNFLQWRKITGILSLQDLQEDGFPEVCDVINFKSPILSFSSQSVNGIVITWVSRTNGREDGVTVERSLNGVSSWSSIGTVGKDIKTITDTSISIETPYYYRARSFIAAEYTAYSNIVIGTVQRIAAPSGLLVTSSVGQNALVWTSNSSGLESGFEIWRNSGGGSFSLLTTNSTGVVTYNDTTVLAEVEYGYYIIATHATGDSVASNTDYGTAPTIAAPSGLSGTNPVYSQVDLTWVLNSGGVEDSVEVERTLYGLYAWANVASLSPGTTSYSNTGVAGDTAYSYRVYVAHTSGDSDYSNEFDITTSTSILNVANPNGDQVIDSNLDYWVNGS
jgi:hypothetical protein